MWYYQLLLRQLNIVQQSSRVIDGTLVLLKPGGDIVGDSSSIVNDGKVSILVSLGLGLGTCW